MAVEAKKASRVQNIDNDGNILGGSADKPVHVSTNGAVGSEVKDGRQTVTTPGTAVALAASTACTEVIATAETDNTDIVVIGGSTVVAALSTRRGNPLYAGDSFAISTNDLAEVFIDALTAGDGVTFTYLV